MRRRTRFGDRSPEALVQVFAEVSEKVAADLPDRHDPRRHWLFTALLAEAGADAVECIIARRELRRRGRGWSR